MENPSVNPLVRWNKINEFVEESMMSIEIDNRTGTDTRVLSRVVISRIMDAVKNGRIPADIADLWTLSKALEGKEDLTPDVESVYLAVKHAWQMRVLAAAAGKGV